MAEKTQFEKLNALLHNQENRATYVLLEPERKQLDAILTQRREYGSHQEMTNAVVGLARSVNEKAPFGFNEQSFSFDPEQYFSNTNQELPSFEEAPSQPLSKDSSMQGPLSGRGPGKNTGSTIHSLQQQQLLDEFDQAMQIQNTRENPTARDDAIRNVLDRLEAPALFGGQVDIVKKYIAESTLLQNSLPEDPQTRKKMLDDLTTKLQQEADKRRGEWEEKEIKKSPTIKTSEKKKDDDLLDSFSNAFDGGVKRKAFQNLLSHRFSQIEDFPLLIEVEYEVPQRPLLRQVTSTMQETVQNQQRVMGGPAGRGATGKIKKAAERKALKKLVGTAVKALGPEIAVPVTILEWISEHKALTAMIIGAVILGAVAIIAAIIILISTLVQNLFGLDQGGGLPGVRPKAPPCPIDCRQAIKDKFDLPIAGAYDYEYRWIWEKFWDISNTKYLTLLKNAPNLNVDIGEGTAYTSYGGGRVHVHLHHFDPNDVGGFDVILLHELGHAIDFSNPDSLSHRGDLPKAVILDILNPFFLHGWMTFYSRDACLYHPPTLGIQLGEDYAEMLTYYLNPKVGMLTACGHGDNPYASGQHSAHLNLVRKILGAY